MRRSGQGDRDVLVARSFDLSNANRHAQPDLATLLNEILSARFYQICAVCLSEV